MKTYPVVDLAKYFVEKYEEINEEPSKLKVQKLLYYAQAFKLSLSNGQKYLFEEDIEPWKYGPVVPVVYQQWSNILDSYQEYEIDEEVKKFLDNVWEYFIDDEPYEMINQTHDEDPWLNTYKKEDRIPLVDIYNYFKGRVKISKLV